CPVAPQRAHVSDWQACRIQGWVDGELRQDGMLSDLLFSPGEILSAVAAVMSLAPGDLVSLGTPEGVGPLLAGQSVRVTLLGPDGDVLAQVTNPVVQG
ncbi:MAG: fumarylacetoacetate hydrolase family protein, partial [Myxococcales bacterium]|nr:fumarylacetoacetate hydrolase family protein [Myxococcales bacterium]